MIVKHIKKFALIGLFFYLPFQSNAWGLLGHRIVGQIADSYLTTKAKTTIAKILGTESIAISSNWPDFIKSDTAYSYLTPWHYIDFNEGLTEEQFHDYLNKDTATDAYTKINFLVKQLKSKLTVAADKKLYLRLLIHIVGDIHQPLHVGHIDDKGGNTIKVLWFSTSYNLHQVWDQVLINFQQLSYTEYTDAINHVTAGQKAAWQKQPLSKWLYDSYQLAAKIYADIKQPEQKLDYGYNFKYIEILNGQLLKGGVHLAGLLNQIFG